MLKLANIDSEREVIAAILANPVLLAEAIGIITANDFSQDAYRHIFGVAEELFLMGERPEFILITEQLNDKGLLEEIGGRSALMELAAEHLTDASFGWNIKNIKDTALLADLKGILMDAEVMLDSHTGEQILCFLQQSLATLEAPGDKTQDKAEVIDTALEEAISDLEGRYVSGLSTGIPSLDSKLNGGFRSGELIILAGRPGMGKSALALNVAMHFSNAGKPVLFFTVEMSATEVYKRALKVCTKTVSRNDLTIAAEVVKKSKIDVVDKMRLDLAGIRSMVMRKNAKEKLGLVVIDYLQLMDGTGENEVNRIGKITRGLKMLANEFSLPVMCLSQLNRAVEARQDKRPLLGDLRASGNIEEDANTVMLMYRDRYYNEGSVDPTTEVIIAKQRNGSPGLARLIFIPNKTKFTDAVKE